MLCAEGDEDTPATRTAPKQSDFSVTNELLIGVNARLDRLAAQLSGATDVPQPQYPISAFQRLDARLRSQAPDLINGLLATQQPPQQAPQGGE